MKSKKNLVIGILCITLVVMEIGYAAFNGVLNITGTAKSSGTFDVEIIKIEETSESETAGGVTTKNATIDNKTEASFSAEFTKPGDYVEYTVTVKNKGTIDAVLTNIEKNIESGNDNNFKFEYTLTDNTEILVNQEIEFNVRLYFNSRSTTLDVEEAVFKLTFDAVQKSGYTQQQASEFELPEWVIDKNGTLLFYNGTEENVEIPDSYNGQTITAIGSMAFNNVGASGLVATDVRDEDNPIFKVFFWEEPSQELKDQMNENGVTPATYEEIINTGYRYNEINMSGGTFVMPISAEFDVPSSRLKSVDMSNMEHLKEIYPNAFSESGNIESVMFPTNGTLISIGKSAFYGNKIRTLNLPQGLKNIDYDAFSDNQLSGTLTIPNSVTSIGNSAFYGRDDGSTNKISSLVFENNSHLQTIGSEVFSGNQISGTLTIPSSVTSIMDYAFSGNKINTLNIGSGLTSLGYGAFVSNSLTTINIDMTESTWNSRNLPTSNWYDGNIMPTYKQE